MSDETQAEAARLAFATLKARMRNDGEAVIDHITELSERQLTVTGLMMTLELVYGLSQMCASILGTTPAALWAGFTEGVASQTPQEPT